MYSYQYEGMMDELRRQTEVLKDILNRIDTLVLMQQPAFLVTEADVVNFDTMKPGDFVKVDAVSNTFLQKVLVPEKEWTVHATVSFGDIIKGEGTVDVELDEEAKKP